MKGTNNFYTQDGYGGGSGSPTAVSPKANYGGGSYINCNDDTQPGIAPILTYLSDLKIPSKCQTGHYYLVNNYNPGYFGDGSNAYIDPNPDNYVYTIPPVTTRSIGDVLSNANVSWAYYGDHWNLVSRRQISAELQQRRRRILQHLQLGAVFDLDHDQSDEARCAAGHSQPIQHPVRHR